MKNCFQKNIGQFYSTVYEKKVYKYCYDYVKELLKRNYEYIMKIY